MRVTQLFYFFILHVNKSCIIIFCGHVDCFLIKYFYEFKQLFILQIFVALNALQLKIIK